MIAIFDPNLKCRHLSREWANTIGLRQRSQNAYEKLGVTELIEPGSQVFVEHRLKSVIKNNQEILGVPVNIRSEVSPKVCRGTLSILPVKLDEDLVPSVAIVFNSDSVRDSVQPSIAEIANANSTQENTPHQPANSNGNGHQRTSEMDFRIQRLHRFFAHEIDLPFAALLGQSNAIRKIQEQVEMIAQTTATVLIEGELGTGKEVVARAIHRKNFVRVHSEKLKANPNPDRPFITFNCAAFDIDEIDERLFGKNGALELADGGTLYLKEVAALPVVCQAKLFTRVKSLLIARPDNHPERRPGSQRMQSKLFEIRIIASSKNSLANEVTQGRFHEDLFCRLSVFPISIPPLRERIDDIFPLTTHFIDTICQKLGRTPLAVTTEQVRQLSQLQWPGNIRELRALIERAILVSDANHLRLDLVLPAESVGYPKDQISNAYNFYTDAEFIKLERKNVLMALQFADWRVSGSGGAAELLGIKPSTLNYRMKKLNIVRNSSEHLNRPR